MQNKIILFLAFSILSTPLWAMEEQSVATYKPIALIDAPEMQALYQQLEPIHSFFINPVGEKAVPGEFLHKALDKLFNKSYWTYSDLMVLQKRMLFFMKLLTDTLDPRKSYSVELAPTVVVSVSRDYFIGMIEDFLKSLGKKIESVKEPAGLFNCGNGCFMNAAFQALSTMEDFCKLVLRKTHFKEHSIAKEYTDFLAAQLSDAGKDLDPKVLCLKGWNTMRTPENTQQCVGEFLTQFFDHLVDTDIEDRAKNKNYEPHTSDVAKLFYTITATQCSHAESGFISEVKTEPLNMIELAIPEEQQMGESSSGPETGPAQPAKHRTLLECLDHYFTSSLSENFKLPPGTRLPAGTEVTVQSRRTIEETGRYIIFALKRNIYKNKLETPVSFPLANLDLSAYFARVQNQKNRYHLRAVIMHQGSINAGHYTAYIRRHNHWFFCNDSVIQFIEPYAMEMISDAGYGTNPRHLPSIFIYEKIA